MGQVAGPLLCRRDGSLSHATPAKNNYYYFFMPRQSPLHGKRSIIQLAEGLPMGRVVPMPTRTEPAA